MATLVLSAAGAALGGGFGGSLFGLSSMVLGRAVGATVGSMIDQRLLGAGAAPVETGRVDRLRVMGSSEGAPLPRCFGRMRVPGQLVWSSRFRESFSEQQVGGKGTGGGQTVRQYSYSISLALALCEGEVFRVGRIWADGQPLAQDGLNWRLYGGSEDQLVDPLIAAIEGPDATPAYRGTAYVVIEDLDLGPFGNRIPQFNFEVFRRPRVETIDVPAPAAFDVRGVALVPGTGEYSLATQAVGMTRSRGSTTIVNVNNDRGLPDLVVSLDQMEAELPRCSAVSLVVSWFGDDLRIDRCALYPAVEQNEQDGDDYPWRVSGVERSTARVVSKNQGRPLFGGTPADQAVVQAIRHMTAQGKAVMFYPFILMDIVKGNGLPNPWSPQSQQPPVPWRGRMTLSRAPGVAGSPDKTPAAAVEVASFFGSAARTDFSVSGDHVTYSGPNEWSYRRFILHYAHLCALAGGVDAFCIGSEMRSLTQIRDGTTSYPAVQALCTLAADVRTILGPNVKISYAADWSEYFGHHPQDGSGDVLFNLDDIWAHPAIDFIGIDNYMPLSDWREGHYHLDAFHGSIYDLDYLIANVGAGEGWDWYYESPAARAEQARQPIEDGAYGETWTFRYKDIRSWWSNAHVNRIAGAKVASPTAWQPQSKPIWFTELGCPAVDKGTNQPNVFFDPKSSESFLPYFSSGARDDFIQQRYLQASYTYWKRPENNPVSSAYGGRMIDLSRAFVWAWDARPWPDFPKRLGTWVDGVNYSKGHWLNGRINNPGLADIIAELCERSNFTAAKVKSVFGTATGYTVSKVESARQSLQPLLMVYGLDAAPADERLEFKARIGQSGLQLKPDGLVSYQGQPRIERTRSPAVERVDRVSFVYVQADQDYVVGSVEAQAAGNAEPSTSETNLPVALARPEAQSVSERWLIESAAAQETIELKLPPSSLQLGIGDVFSIGGGNEVGTYRIDRIHERGAREVKATRVNPAAYVHKPLEERPSRAQIIRPASPAHVEFLELPILQGDEDPNALHLAAIKIPWMGPIAVYAADDDTGYRLAGTLDRPATMGRLLEPLAAGHPGLWMRDSVLVRLEHGALESCSEQDVLRGMNVAAIKRPDDWNVEVIQFRDADMVAPRTYQLSFLLRGQAGTDAAMPEVWPEGSDFVLLNQAVKQIDQKALRREELRHYRYGPADRPLTDPSYRLARITFNGAALRPYRPVHLFSSRQTDRTLEFKWIRRSRLGGDNWEGADVPIGEERILFALRIHSGPILLRSSLLDTTTYRYGPAQQMEDGMAPTWFEVAQVSDVYGSGPFARKLIDD